MQDAQRVILRVLDRVGKSVNSTRLVKLVYLVDYTFFQHFGRTLTGFRYEWSHHGPNAVGHAIISEADKLARRGLVQSTQSPNIYGGTTFEYRIISEVPALPPEAELVIDDITKQFGGFNTTKITALSKKTTPFVNASQYAILEMEQLTTPMGTTAEDYQRYKEQEEQFGTTSLEELARR